MQQEITQNILVIDQDYQHNKETIESWRKLFNYKCLVLVTERLLEVGNTRFIFRNVTDGLCRFQGIHYSGFIVGKGCTNIPQDIFTYVIAHIRG